MCLLHQPERVIYRGSVQLRIDILKAYMRHFAVNPLVYSTVMRFHCDGRRGFVLATVALGLALIQSLMSFNTLSLHRFGSKWYH